MEEKLPEIGKQGDKLNWEIDSELVTGQGDGLNLSPGLPLPAAFIPSRNIFQVPLLETENKKTLLFIRHRFK